MTKPKSPIDMLTEAAASVKNDMQDMIRETKANVVNRPLVGKKLSPAEQHQQYEQFREDSALIEAEWDRLTEKYGSPRRLIDYAKAGERKWRERQEIEDSLSPGTLVQ